LAAVTAIALSITIADADQEAGRPAIDAVRVEHDEAGVRVSYRVLGAFNDDVLERVQSGMRLSFEHRAVLLGQRVAGVFPRATLAKTVVETTVSYDTLTQRYELERRVIGKGWPKTETAPDRIEESSTSSREEMEAWMTSVRDIPLPSPAEETGPFKIKLRTDLGLRFLLMILPWPKTVTAETWLELES
jgi:hypothetical protein